jgi:pyruvate kinase
MIANASFRRTRIIFTLGPATESEEMLEKLFRAGADVVRLNMAHAKHDWTRQVIRRIRAVSKRVHREVAIMMDIKGPEIRTGDLRFSTSPLNPRTRPAAAAARRSAPST